ncbi:AAA family ATPase [Thiocapsa sp. UBA6158]|jgi:WD40 repeat protein|uniref:nSTAND1 domain-containing NTPase n=1 Tax=Thiocapsa sp. UBA6158 TaxID=1947692 RepID=UPI0025F1A2E6|nr:AAA family ATPase [Thiocapsa sp. UBA6158]
MTEHKVRIFVSSPSDLEHERALVKDVIEALAQEYLPYFSLQAVLWEEEALTAAQSFQAGLLRPSECEIVLVMLWTRLGTPLAEDPYEGMTGTEWEFVDAVRESARTGTPEVLVYKKTAPRMVDVNNAEATREALADRHRLEEFFRTHFFNPDGSFRRAFRQFGNDRSFRELLETQLRKLLNRRISAERRLASDAADWRGSPFRAGAPFEVVDDRVFTGRETETRELVTRLETLQGSGRGLLLLSGPSGVGKSSLIRAGLLPRLIRPFLFPGIAGCRWGFVDLDDRDPIEALAVALAAPGLLGPALDAFGLDVARLTRLLVSEPEVAADQLLAALAQLADDPASRSDGANGRLQLAIIVDPLDRLFTESMRGASRTRSFFKALVLLAARDDVWVISSLRSDYLRHLGELPELAALLDEQSWFRLEPPPAARIRQVIEIPARVAGIEYEGMAGGGRGLVEALESEASLLEHWPAVLEPLLDELYGRARDGSGTGESTRNPPLTLADYRRVGGLSGSLLRRADALWEALDPETRDALPVLCRSLIALEGGGTSALGARRGDLLTLTRHPAVGRLVESLIEARLLVAEGVADPSARLGCTQEAPRLMDDLRRIMIQTGEEWRERLRSRRGIVGRDVSVPSDGVFEVAPDPAITSAEVERGEDPDAVPVLHWEDYRALASFIHPALFERWSPIRDWVADPSNRRDLILRYQISRQARLWRRTDCNREYLLGEAGYAAARRFADAYGEELEPLEQELLEHSHQHLVLQRRRNRWARLLGLTLAALLVLATGAAFWAWDASREATLNLQRSLLKAADLAVRQGNTPEAVRLALNAGPYLPEAATDTLSRAFTTNRMIAMVHSEVMAGDQPLPPAFRDDGERLVTQSRGDGAQLWALRGLSYQPEARLFGPRTPIHSVRFIGSAEPQTILGIGEAGVWRLPAEPGRPPDWSCGARSDSPIALDRDGRFLAISHAAPQDRYAVCLLDLGRPGAPLWDVPVHASEVRSIAFAPDGELLVTASRDGTARVLETRTGTERVVLPTGGSLGRPANDARFDPAGRRISVASADERIRVYDLDGSELAELGVIERDGRRIRIHKSAVREAVFSPGGQYLIAGDDAGQVVRWDLESRNAEVLGHHDLSVEHVRVSPGMDDEDREPLVLSASLDKTARLWGLLSGKEVAVFSHDAAVTDARFSSDGRRVLSYSDPDGSARLWSVKPTETLAFHLPSVDHVWHLAMAETPAAATGSPDAGTTESGSGSVMLATAAFDGRVEVWQYDRRDDAPPPVRIRTLRGHEGRVRRVAFSPSADRLASAGHDGTARVWNLSSGGGCRLEVSADGSPCSPDSGRSCPSVHQALFAPDGRWLITTSSDLAEPVRFWDTLACAPLDGAPGWGEGGSAVQAAAVSEGLDGTTLVATGDDGGGVRIMRVDSTGGWAPVCAAQWHTKVVTDVAFSRNGRWLATSSEDGSAALVGLTDGGCASPRYLEPQAGILYSVAFAPESQALVTASLNAKAQVWALDGSLLANLVGHKDRIYAAKFSPDGRWILTASRDGAVRIWMRPTRPSPLPEESFLTLDGDLGGVAYADFSPDGHTIGAAYWENATLLWRLWTEEVKPERRLETIWGRDRARLALIREAARFKAENRLDRRELEISDAVPSIE